MCEGVKALDIKYRERVYRVNVKYIEGLGGTVARVTTECVRE